MAKRNSPPQRIDPKFEEQMRACALERVNKGLAKFKKDEISIREMTNLATRTASWGDVLKELKTKPKRK